MKIMFLLGIILYLFNSFVNTKNVNLEITRSENENNLYSVEEASSLNIELTKTNFIIMNLY